MNRKRGKAVHIVLAAFLLFAVFALTPKAAHAVDTGLQYLTTTGLTTTDIRTFVSRIIRYFLGLLGFIAVCLMMYAGYTIMTAAGSAEKVEKGKKIMINAVIGLVIITSAYAIVAFLFRALTGEGLGGSGSGSGTQLGSLFTGNRGTALGNGIIEYHYPEPGQIDVPRNTKIAITFKKPLVLSSILKNYDDKGTYDKADDEICPSKPPCSGGTPVTANTPLELNTDNVKIIPNESLGTPGSGTADEQFNNRYPDSGAVITPAPKAAVTAVVMPYKGGQMQTITIKPLTYLGSPVTDINYRVAIRGGENGLKVWAEKDDGTPEIEDAFQGSLSVDGGYYWSFTTNTTIDVTPPKIIAVIPTTTPIPGTPDDSVLDRNQLLQIYFDEAVDPTTASGIIGTGGGFNNIEVKAECLPGVVAPNCVFPGGTVDGTLVLGNRYRTAEFMPAAPCEGITENSCGETVYCLPKNVKLTVTSKAATVDLTPPKEPEPPAAALDNGVEDMVGNSLDGNGNGTTEGPQIEPQGAQPGGKVQLYYVNDPPADLSTVSDSSFWVYNVGSNVDLTVPQVKSIDPPAFAPPPSNEAWPTGPSKIPTTLPISATWSKVMSVGSMRTGAYGELPPPGAYKDPYSTVVLRSYECEKTDRETPCQPGVKCPCNRLEPAGFYIGGQDSDSLAPGSMLVPNPSGTGYVTRMSILHPAYPFFTADDLGYTEDDVAAAPENVPAYLPILRAKLKDTKQNCFYPSRFQDCSAAAGPNPNSCCNKYGEDDGQFLGKCTPVSP